jgi:uncharacterized membrane protein
MNDAHLHMVVNHFPIIGTIFGLGILIFGIFLKNNSLKNTAYFLFIIAAVFGFLSMNTGEGAEEIVEDFPNIGKKIIHEHEEIAEKLALVLYALGLVSIIGLYLTIKNNAKANLVSYLAVIIAVVAVFLGKQVGTSGGEIRHTEIRENTTQTVIENQNSATNEHSED